MPIRRAAAAAIAAAALSREPNRNARETVFW